MLIGVRTGNVFDAKSAVGRNASALGQTDHST